LSDEQICREREFQFSGKDRQKAQEAKEDLGPEGTARRRQLTDCKALGGLCGFIKSAK